MQKELLKDILNSIPQPELALSDSAKFTELLFHAFHAHQTLIDILFSGSQSSVLPTNIEKELKEYIFKMVPNAAQDAKVNILLTFQILGGFYAYQRYHKKYEIDYIMDVLNDCYRIKYPGME